MNDYCSHKLMYVIIILLSTQLPVCAQQPPPNTISIYVNPSQGLMFGAFFQGISGGTITIYPNGSRVATGDVIQANLGFAFSPAIIEVEANPGTLVSILNGADALLAGSNGGTMTLHIGTASTGTPFITTATPPARTQIRIGGILTIGSPLANPAGAYNGTFSITFIQE
ncbi:DUF4402 domain-containing protein [Chitinophaga oryziterrae]|uniref:DUF4402 domain-containing protein n=1 Tax=Chitinophaga oryziterrae TaxID=1031224 RepID=A0A6N8JC80_9BACT|nr:DUF4402 domain-containing protein [Chitinophaga oryziterrae]MVT41936.1 DUF4402 domain-containing protein [Chitinophaga oryziterrae]